MLHSFIFLSPVAEFHSTCSILEIVMSPIIFEMYKYVAHWTPDGGRFH